VNETMVTVVGNVATAPVFREFPSGSVARFRLAATARRRDRETGTWSDGHTNFFTVWAWRGLGTNVAASLSVGEPVIVQGKLKVRNEERSGGQPWMSADIEAVAVGHDLSRGTAAFRRPVRTEGASTASGAPPLTEPGSQPAVEGRSPVQWERPPQQAHAQDGDQLPQWERPAVAQGSATRDGSLSGERHAEEEPPHAGDRPTGDRGEGDQGAGDVDVIDRDTKRSGPEKGARGDGPGNPDGAATGGRPGDEAAKVMAMT
jgi:single-strand DNA-binding protein